MHNLRFFLNIIPNTILVYSIICHPRSRCACIQFYSPIDCHISHNICKPPRYKLRWFEKKKNWHRHSHTNHCLHKLPPLTTAISVPHFGLCVVAHSAWMRYFVSNSGTLCAVFTPAKLLNASYIAFLHAPIIIIGGGGGFCGCR